MKQYEIFELQYTAPAPQNAVAADLTGTFCCGESTTMVKGFYAGNNCYKLRFLPLNPGEYSYQVSGIVTDSGTIRVFPADGNCHGIPQTEGLHLRFSDGSLFTPFGTTVYALAHQEEALVEKTLETLKNSPFNKIRMCVFPKHYQYNHNEPPFYPFAVLPGKSVSDALRQHDTGHLWDVANPDYAFWDVFEEKLHRLNQLGITVDLILFHPYDRWGFSTLSMEENLLYLDYTLRRLSAFPNLMWSLANEYDLVPGRTMEEWYRLEEFVAQNDPYHHMLSNHNCFVLYDYSRPNITHVSIQTRDPSRVPSLMKYGKPVLVDECAYEGNLEETFGSLTGQEMNDRFWKITCTGGYATHGETFVNYDAENPDDEIVFWAKGGKLAGESPERIGFLKVLVEELPGPIEFSPGSGFAPLMYMDKPALLQIAKMVPPEHAVTLFAVADMGEEERLYHLTTESEYNGRVEDRVFLRYFGRDVHSRIQLDLPENIQYTVEVIDTWNMTRTTLPGTYSGVCKVRMPNKPWMAVFARRIG